VPGAVTHQPCTLGTTSHTHADVHANITHLRVRSCAALQGKAYGRTCPGTTQPLSPQREPPTPQRARTHLASSDLSTATNWTSCWCTLASRSSHCDVTASTTSRCRDLRAHARACSAPHAAACVCACVVCVCVSSNAKSMHACVACGKPPALTPAAAPCMRIQHVT